MYKKYGGIIHCNDCDDINYNFINKYKYYDSFSLSKLINYIPVMKNYFTLYRNNLSNYINNFYSEINYFLVTPHNNINFYRLDNILSINNHKLIYSSRTLPYDQNYNNILFHNYISTNDLIKCLLYKKIIFYIKRNSYLYKDRTSGLLHLAASFNTPIYIPIKLYDLYPEYHKFNFIPYSSDKDLISLL
jgi:hypothetical protein